MWRLMREIMFFATLFLLLGLSMHMDKWLSAPFSHWQALEYHTMPWHPLVYTLGIYVAIGVIRMLLALLLRPFRKPA